MATTACQEVPVYVTAPAAADLSASQYCGVDYNSSGQAALPSAGGRCVGVLNNDPAAVGRAATIQIGGVARMKLGGTVTAGENVKVDSSGRAVTAAAGEEAFGVCRLGGAINQFGEVQIGKPNTVAGGDLEIVSANGAVSVVTRTTLLSISGTKAYTLAAGKFAGQRKTIQASVAAAIPSGVVTGTFLDTDGTTARTTATFDAVADQLELEWKAASAAWQVLLKTSVTMG